MSLARRALEGAAESASAHSAGPGICSLFVGLWVCLFVCLLGCDEIKREKHEK